MLIEIAPRVNLQAVTVDQILETIRELLELGDRPTLNQNRNDRYPAAEGCLDFDADWVGRIIDPPPPPSRTKPALADHNQSDIGLAEHRLDILAKVSSDRDVINITKYRIATIMSH